MAHPIRMPKFGQTVEECTIVRWHKKEGDRISKGEVLFEIETDKATLEIESFLEGTLLRIVVKEDQPVPVQSVVGYMGEPGEPIPETPPPSAALPTKTETPAPPVSSSAASKKPAAKQVPQPVSRPGVPAGPVAAVAAPPTAPVAAPFAYKEVARLIISPRARKLASESVIDPASINGTGPGNRIVEKDVKTYLDAHGYNNLRISPAAKRLAAPEKIDVLTVRGTGDGGRILTADVNRAIAEKPKAMTKMRQIIAQRLTQSFTSTPHFFVTVAADMTELLALRAELKEVGKEYSVTDFILESVVLALQEFPDVNSTTDGKTVWWHSKVHLGLAVALDKGLVVAVIRDADELAFAELHDRVGEHTSRARQGKLMPDEMTGSTFTISNMGMLDVENFTAIINPGESAILAVSSTVKKPVVRNDKVVVRSIMKMTLSADHRIVDGAMAARFMNAIQNKLEDVELWRLLK